MQLRKKDCSSVAVITAGRATTTTTTTNITVRSCVRVRTCAVKILGKTITCFGSLSHTRLRSFIRSTCAVKTHLRSVARSIEALMHLQTDLDVDCHYRADCLTHYWKAEKYSNTKILFPVLKILSSVCFSEELKSRQS